VRVGHTKPLKVLHQLRNDLNLLVTGSLLDVGLIDLGAPDAAAFERIVKPRLKETKSIFAHLAIASGVLRVRLNKQHL
jgi:hypothetical protein